MPGSEVNEAFEILLNEIEDVIDSVNAAVGAAVRERDYTESRRLIDEAERVEAFRLRVAELQAEWRRELEQKGVSAAVDASGEYGRRRLPRGLRTPEEAYRVPILSALVQQGGSAPMRAVLELVYEQMKESLNEYDLRPLASDPQTPRWRNTAQWCRNTLVREGLMADDSPRGVWEITPEGRAWLSRHREA